MKSQSKQRHYIIITHLFFSLHHLILITCAKFAPCWCYSSTTCGVAAPVHPQPPHGRFNESIMCVWFFFSPLLISHIRALRLQTPTENSFNLMGPEKTNNTSSFLLSSERTFSQNRNLTNYLKSTYTMSQKKPEKPQKWWPI